MKILILHNTNDNYFLRHLVRMKVLGDSLTAVLTLVSGECTIICSFHDLFWSGKVKRSVALPQNLWGWGDLAQIPHPGSTIVEIFRLYGMVWTNSPKMHGALLVSMEGDWDSTTYTNISTGLPPDSSTSTLLFSRTHIEGY